VGVRNYTWLSQSSQSFRTVFSLTVPDSSSVTIECQFNTSVNASGSKQFRNQKSIYSFTVNSSGGIQQLTGSPDLISESASLVSTFIGQSQVVNSAANTLAFQVNLGFGGSVWSGKTVVSFTATVNSYQGH
jgi:hypothetical protein